MTWLVENSDWSALIWGGAITVAVFVAATVAGIALAGIILVKMPVNYFCDNYCRDFWTGSHPLVRWIGRVLKNLLGASLVVLGGVLSLPGVPGPGLLTILLGITLLDCPGKRRMERWLIGRPVVLNAINRLRRRYGKSPIVLESPEHMDGTSSSQHTAKEPPMRLHFRGKNLRVTEAMREHSRLRLMSALGRFARRIQDVTSSLTDVNGPRGGVDMQCRLVVSLRPKGKVTIEETAADLFAAIARAADRAGQTVARALERRRDKKTNRAGFSPHSPE